MSNEIQRSPVNSYKHIKIRKLLALDRPNVNHKSRRIRCPHLCPHGPKCLFASLMWTHAKGDMTLADTAVKKPLTDVAINALKPRTVRYYVTDEGRQQE